MFEFDTEEVQKASREHLKRERDLRVWEATYVAAVVALSDRYSEEAVIGRARWLADLAVKGLRTRI